MDAEAHERHLTALRRELDHAKCTKPGGQTSDPARVALIEEAIRQHTGKRKPGRPRKETADYTQPMEHADDQ